jgi:GNAT superfamily N-acetyltransferase
MITIRLAIPADAERLARLRWDFRTELRLDPTPPPHTWEEFQVEMLAFLTEAFASSSWAIWLAEEDEQITANLYIRRIRKVPNPAHFMAEIGYVTNVYCIPERRNQGVGDQLMQAAQEWAKAEGLELLFLWPSKRSVPFYLRHGFSKENAILEFLIEGD